MKPATYGIKSVTGNIRSGLTLFGRKPASSTRFTASIGAITALLLVLLLIDSAIALATLFPTVRFSIWGLHSFALFTCALLAINGLVVAGRPWQFARVLTMWVSGLVCLYLPVQILIILALSMQWSTRTITTLVIIVAGLHITLLYRISRQSLYRTHTKSAVVSVAATGLLVTLIAIVPDTKLWIYDWSADTGDNQSEIPRLNTEDVYYKQAALIQKATDKIKPQKDGVKELFLLGFGGEGDNVFKNETLSVQSIADAKLGTTGHSSVLINNADTIDLHPIASVHNLRAMLKILSSKMNTDEDVLMLYLTSHGSTDHQLSVKLDDLDLNALPAEVLADIVKSSGIKWKVIIVSACYSGGFIAPLKDEHTVVITAARHDRTSFGCESENDYTYFGNAYFNEAINAGHTIIESFSIAKASISRREQQEELTPSEPQIFIGSGVNGYLDDLTTALPFSTSNPGVPEYGQ